MSQLDVSPDDDLDYSVCETDCYIYLLKAKVGGIGHYMARLRIEYTDGRLSYSFQNSNGNFTEPVVLESVHLSNEVQFQAIVAKYLSAIGEWATDFDEADKVLYSTDCMHYIEVLSYFLETKIEVKGETLDANIAYIRLRGNQVIAYIELDDFDELRSFARGSMTIYEWPDNLERLLY